MAVEDLIVMRNKDDVQSAIQQMTQLQAGTPGNAPAAATQAPGAGQPQPDLAGPAMNQPQYQMRSTSK